MKRALLVAAAILILSVTLSYARPGDPFTQHGCGRNVVSKGDPADKVLQYCGQPTSVEVIQGGTVTDYRSGHRTSEYKTRNREEWLYNKGTRGGLYKMTFYDGILFSITDMGAGY